MKVLLLGPERPEVEAAMAAVGDEVLRTDGRIDRTSAAVKWADFLVSFGYRHIIPGDVLALFGHRAVNLHISLLPWNRGADPNLWSYLDDTPRGVTIHVLDADIDTGPIIIQREVAGEPDDTLRTSYDRLTGAMIVLFVEAWPRLRAGELAASPQAGAGTTHRAADKDRYEGLLTAGWDTPVTDLLGRAHQ